LLVVAGVALYRSAVEVFSTEQRVERTKQVLDELDDLLNPLSISRSGVQHRVQSEPSVTRNSLVGMKGEAL